jgi:phage/plasmid-like protein (TIGR03299 family)
MAANLDYSNDRVNYAYVLEHGSVWHGEGNVLPLKSPLIDWKREAGLEWEAISSPILFNDNIDMPTVFPDKIALFRSDNQLPLSIVSQSYKIVQPAEVVDFFSDLLEQHDMEMSSCGSLFDGKRFFATAKLNDIEIIPGDITTGYLLLATSLDGSMATTAKTTSVRTVCSNTLTMAINQKSANMIKVPHSTEFDASRAKLDLGLIDESQERFIQNMRKLASARVTDKEAFSIYKNMFYNPEVEADKQHGTVVKRIDDIMDLYLFGNGAEYGRGTMYNVLQGITDYYSNKIKNRTESAKFWHTFYGSTEKIKLESQQKLLELVG